MWDKQKEESLIDFKKILRKVIKREMSDHNIIMMKYNQLVQENYMQVVNHYENILNINTATVEEIIRQANDSAPRLDANKLKLLTICLSIENIKTLCNLICNCSDEMVQYDNKIAAYAKRILEQNKNPDYKFFDIPYIQRNGYKLMAS